MKMMNKFSLLSGFILISLILVHCKKVDESNPDYRLNFVGNFKFLICETNWFMTPHDSTLYYYTYDTTYTNGSIGIYHKNQLLIKYNSSKITGIWREDTTNCRTGSYTAIIDDSLINNPPSHLFGYDFAGYYDNWVSPIFHSDSTLEVACIPYKLTGAWHEAFGGYFIDSDSLLLFYSSGGIGAGSYKYIYGKRY